jgi:hypothetical protein
MGKYFAQSSYWVAFFAFFCPYFASAEAIPPISIELAAREDGGDGALATASAVARVQKKALLFRHCSYPAAWKAAQETNRPILVYVCMPNCPHCVKMQQQTFGLPHVERLVTDSFETLNAGRYSHAILVQKLNIKWYPTTVLVGPNNKVLDMIEGYVDAKNFQLRLQTGLASLAPTTLETQTR